MFLLFFFFNDTATTDIYTLSLHDALPILQFVDIDKIIEKKLELTVQKIFDQKGEKFFRKFEDRKSTRLNSSH